METVTQRGARPLLVVGGDLALDFANTVDDPRGPHHFDHLGDADRLLTWAHQRGLLDEPERRRLLAGAQADPTSTARGLRRIHRLRDAVLGGFTAVAERQPFTAPAWRELRPAVADAVAHADLGGDPRRPHPSWTRDDLDAVRLPVAHAAYALLLGANVHRIKHCACCHWLFLDRSKNGSRRWCSMDDCGTSVKKRRYVERRAARRRP
jgi:predicted RNA-binding Zn ribbon-like protein